MFYLNKWVCFHFCLGVILCHYFYKVFFFLIAPKVPVILWWTSFIPTDRYIYCSTLHEKPKCLVTNDRSYFSSALLGAVVFYGSHLTNHDFPLPRSHSVLWSLYQEESPKNMPALLDLETQNLFNFTATFSRHSSYPLTLQYLRDPTMLTDKKYFVDVAKKNLFLDDLAPVLYIQSNCDTITDRDILVSELMKFVKVDSYGNCLNNRKFPKWLEDIDPLDIYNEDLLNFISRYKFIISFENAICEDYISEKLWRPLIVGSIPIYLGSATVEDWLPNNKSAILVKDFKDINSLADYMNVLNNNDTLYNTYLHHKIFGLVTNNNLKRSLENKRKEHEILNFECFICEKLHEKSSLPPQQYRTDNSFNCQEPREGTTWYDLWRTAKYQSEALSYRIGQNKSFGEKEFEESLLYFLNK